MSITRHATSAKAKGSAIMFAQLQKSLEIDRESLTKSVKGVVVFKIDDTKWTLDARPEKGELYQGSPKNCEADLTLTINDDNFVKLVMGKLNPQSAFLMRKLKISGSMGMAMKLQPILEAAQPQSKL